MAFQAPPAGRPRLHLSQMNSSTYQDSSDSPIDGASSPTLSRQIFPLTDEEEWVLFSPSLSAGPSSSATATKGDALASGAGSYLEDSEAFSQQISTNVEPSYGIFDGTEYSEEAQTSEPTGNDKDRGQGGDGDSLLKEDGETDSLGVFQAQFHQNPVLLPTHDGRGMFPPLTSAEHDRAMLGLVSLEESLRLARRSSGVFDQAADLDARIQKWRAEQSDALLEESERSKRRKANNGDHMSPTLLGDEDEATLSMLGGDIDVRELKDIADNEPKTNDETSKTFLRRITRCFIRDILGIDDNILEIIFGETLPEDAAMPETESTKQAWERGLLERIARELGVLIEHYTKYPSQGAFSTYSRWITRKKDNNGMSTPKPNEQTVVDSVGSAKTKSQIDFKPTLPQQTQEEFSIACWGIEDHAASAAPYDPPTNARAEAQRRKEYWEQELSVRVFFSYLKSHFTPRSTSPPKASRSSPVPTLDQRPVHHHHPLIQRKTRRSLSSSHVAPSSSTPWNIGGSLGYRTGSSCASHSTRTSKKFVGGTASKGKGKRSHTGSTIGKGFYWEAETSVGSGRSCVGMGVWGEI